MSADAPERDPAPLVEQPDGSSPPARRWVWMDNWDPGTWDMPTNPTRLQRVLAGVALVVILVMTIYLPLKILGVL